MDIVDLDLDRENDCHLVLATKIKQKQRKKLLFYKLLNKRYPMCNN